MIAYGESWRLITSLYATGGASGAGVLQTILHNQGDPRLFWVGNITSGNSVSTTARVLTWGSWGFIQDYSPEY